jgi:CotH kinase protein/Chitobiase/beta-hexosaminidase C-terminal domain
MATLRGMAALLAAAVGACSGSGSADDGFDAGPPDAAPFDPCDPLGDRPGVCPARGVYPGPIQVELRAPPGSEVYFTVDGSEPDEASGTLYTGPVELAPPADRGVVFLRARAVDPATGPRPVVTHSYVFAPAVLAQGAAPAGFPAVWGNGATRPADYQMDARVLLDPVADAAALGALPTVSLLLAPDDLWGPEQGIYMNPAQDGVTWERPASIEIVGDGMSAQTGCGVRIQGGSSTQGWKAAKLSMRVSFKQAYGADELALPLFGGDGDGDAGRYDVLILDAHLNMTWSHPDQSQRIRADYIRDRFASDLQLAVGSHAPRGRFVHLYLNGLYWGLYELHERPDEHFAASYLGGDDDSYEVLKHTREDVVNGDAAAYDALFALARQGLADPARYAAIADQLDVADFIDYMLVNFYAGNEDWSHHNWYAARRKPNGRWHFFSWDAEHVLKDVAIDRTAINDPAAPGELYQLLRENPDFRAALSARAAEIESSIVLESGRWGDVNSPEAPHDITQWRAEQTWLQETWFPGRPAVVAGQLDEP